MSFSPSLEQSRPYDAFMALGINLAFALGKNYGDHIGKLMQSATEKNNPKTPDIFASIPAIRPDINNLLEEHAVVQ